jgi:competence protein ComEC
LLLSPVPAAASFVADATQPAMALLDAIARQAGSPGWAVMTFAPSLAVVLLLAIGALLFVRGTAARRLSPWIVGAATAVTLAIWTPLLSQGNGSMELHLIDVGQGDAIALRTPRGRWVVVDAGPRWEGGDAGARTVAPYLQRRGGDVALFVLSHAHDDHAGGAATLLARTAPARWWEPAFLSPSPGYRAALAAAIREPTVWERVHPGARWQLDGVILTVLAPDSAWTAAQSNANETSVVLRIDYGAHRMLLTGDAEANEERWILGHYPAQELVADVLKVGHHGSRTSSGDAWLDAVQPRLGLVSVGAGNRYGHPSLETLERFTERSIPLFRTDQEGTIIVRSDGTTLELVTGSDRWIVPPRSSTGATRPGATRPGATRPGATR